MHIPVLLGEVLQYLDPQPGDIYLDVTAGYGGHAAAMLERTLQPKNCVLVDRDQEAVSQLQHRFARKGTHIVHSDFATASAKLGAEGRSFDVILADLGVSSPHLENASRGFSFTNTGPLDMRMDRRQTVSAHWMVNEMDEQELADILHSFGEEPRARAIAKAIVAARPIQTTGVLAQVVARAAAHRAARGTWKKHPATRTFQAIRIAVNDELGMLKRALPLWVKLLKPGGRLGVISFHSLEDRLVKQFFVDQAGERYDTELRLLTKKAVMCNKKEIVLNPRARSAKFRAVVKIKKPPEA